MCCHPFGASSSASIANFVLKNMANQFANKYSPEAIQVLLHSTYMDDVTYSHFSSEHMVKMAKELISLCNDGGFRLHKITSSDIFL